MLVGFLRAHGVEKLYSFAKSDRSLFWLASEKSFELDRRVDVVIEVAVNDEFLTSGRLAEFFRQYRLTAGGFEMSSDEFVRQSMAECAMGYRLPGPAADHWGDGDVMTLGQYMHQVGKKTEAALALNVNYLTLMNCRGTEVVLNGRLYRPSVRRGKRAAGDDETAVEG